MNHDYIEKKQTVSVFLKGLLIGILSLSSFYYLLLFFVTGNPQHPLTQFLLFQPWMSLLILGFGMQMGLFWLMRQGFRFNLQEKSDANVAAGTSGTVSGLAMVACCAHHAVDLLPILGLSAFAIFLSQYQEQLLIIGVISNVLGIGWMLWLITGKPQLKTIFQSKLQNIRRTK